MDIFQLLLSALGEWPSLLLTIFGLLVGGWYFLKRSKSQYEDALRKAQSSAMEAMKEESGSLRRRIEDIEKENARLNHIIEAMNVALKAKKILITILGENVDVHMEEEIDGYS